MKRYLKFYKYHGTGNDFVMIDGRGSNPLISSGALMVRAMCDRRFGIGADGVIVIDQAVDADIKMDYYNSDGNPGSMCGNGGRCAVSFARSIGLAGDICVLKAYDGKHRAICRDDGLVELEMMVTDRVKELNGDCIIDTGSPHLIRWVQSVEELDVFNTGREIRYSDQYRKNGINVNFVERRGNGIQMRTYERGVEDETLSCGTGTVAASLAFGLDLEDGHHVIPVTSRGGQLEVKFIKRGNAFYDIWLCGPAVRVFEGIFQYG